MAKKRTAATVQEAQASAGVRQERKKPQGSQQAQAVELPKPSARVIAGLCVALAVVTIAIYAQTGGFKFVAYDDHDYVYQNPMVKEGLTAEGFRYAFDGFHCSNWHPLTLLSHMLDCQVFGQRAGAHHLVNVGYHIANTILLFLAFTFMTGRAWRSAIVAGVFAVHPLHVESVAWVAERKDVLSTFLGLVTLLLYLRYTQKRTVVRYAPIVVVFALALLAKPMMVTWPFVLLLVDIWPLGRVGWPPRIKRSKVIRQGRIGTTITGGQATSATQYGVVATQGSIVPLVLEKVPLFVLVAASSVVTFMSQKATGAMAVGMELKWRIPNVIAGYATYIWKSVWPTDMGVLYPIGIVPTDKVVVSAIAIGAITVAVLVWGRKRPYLPVGWFWYVGMLVPVIGIVQVGSQAVADRYMYLPMVGLAFAVVWLVGDLTEKRPAAQRVAAVVAGGAIIAFGAQAYTQTGYWRSSTTLFTRTLSVTERNFIIHNNFGVALMEEKRNDEALAQYAEALKIDPNYSDAHANLGHALLCMGRYDECLQHLQKAMELQPKRADSKADFGVLMAVANRLDDSKKAFDESLALSPDHSDVRSNYAYTLVRLGQYDEAIAQCKEAMRLDRKNANAYFNMANALAALGRNAEAVVEYQEALKLDSKNADAYFSMGNAYAALGKSAEAVEAYQEVLVLKPERIEAKAAIERLGGAAGGRK